MPYGRYESAVLTLREIDVRVLGNVRTRPAGSSTMFSDRMALVREVPIPPTPPVMQLHIAKT